MTVAAVAFVALMLVVGCGGGDEEGEATPDLDGAGAATGTAAATVAGTAEVERPEVGYIDCRKLATQEEIDEAIDIWNRPRDQWNTFGLSKGETCGQVIDGHEEVFVQYGPGAPSDFAPGRKLLGVEGVRVEGVGDAAIWFGGPAAEGGGRQGMLSVAQESTLGGVVFRIALGRPELDSAGQLEAAKVLALAMLPRFPGVELAVPEPVEVLIDDGEPVDRSGQGFVENLLAQETDGEWTRSEGLIATLQYLAGERDASEVLRQGDVLYADGTAVVRLAQEYVESGDDAEAVAELERLLGLMAPRRAMVTPSAEGARLAPGGGTRTMAIQEEEGSLEPDEQGCLRPYPAHGNPCFDAADAAPEFNGKYLFLYPILEPGETEWEGWTYGPSTVRDAIRKTAQLLESMDREMIPVQVWLAPFEGHSAVWSLDGQCIVQLNKGAQALRDLDPPLLQQAVAGTLARCYADWNFGPIEQWEAPVSWYLSDVVYPRASFERVVLKVPTTLAQEEWHTPLDERSLSNMAFFEHLDAALGLEGTMDATAAIYAEGIEAVDGIGDLYHEYAKGLTDGVIVDQGGAYSYGPPTRFEALGAGKTIVVQVPTYGTRRVGVSVESGEYACLQYPDGANLDVWVSWRQGAPQQSGSWTGNLPDAVSGESMFVMTAADPGGMFRISVKKLSDNADCEDEEDGGGQVEPDDCSMDFCDPSEFFWVWEEIRQYVISEN